MPVTFISSSGTKKFTLPIGSIIFRESSGGAGLEAYTSFSGYYIASGSVTDTVTIFGSLTHSHTQSATVGNAGAHTHTGDGGVGSSASVTINKSVGAENTCWQHGHDMNITVSSSGDHTHTINLTTETANNAPPYKELLCFRVTGADYKPLSGDILMWYGSSYTFPSEFILYTSTNNRFLKPSNSATNTGGSWTHAHAILGLVSSNATHSHTGTYSIVDEAAGSGGWAKANSGGNGGAPSHSHGMNPSSSTITGSFEHSHEGFASNSGTAAPPKTFLYFMQKSGTTEAKEGKGAIVGWISGDIPTGWAKLSSSYDNGLIIGYNETSITYSSPTFVAGVAHSHTSPSSTSVSASTSHSHSSVAYTVGSGPGANVYKGSDPSQTITNGGHTHPAGNITINSDTRTHAHSLTNIAIGNDVAIPQYKKLMLIVKVS